MVQLPLQDATGSEGGVFQGFIQRCHTAIFFYLNHSSVVIYCLPDSPEPIQAKSGGR